MKKLFFIIFGIVLLFEACSDDENTIAIAKLDLVSGSEEFPITLSEDGTRGNVDFTDQGGTLSVIVETNQTDWIYRVEERKDWFEVHQNGDTLVLTVAQNKHVTSREAVVEVRAGSVENNATCKLTVKQSGVEGADLAVTPEKLEFPIKGGSLEVEVKTNQKLWSISISNTVFTIVKSDNKVRVTAEENLYPVALTAELTIVSGEGENLETAVIPIVQEAAPAVTLTVDPASIHFTMAGGVDTIHLKMQNTHVWQYVCEQEWLELKAENDYLIVTAPKNSSYDALTAEIMIVAGIEQNYAGQTVTVVQEASSLAEAMIFELSVPANATAVLPLLGTVDCSVDWGDGSEVETVTTVTPTHVYAQEGVYEVKISGKVTGLGTNKAIFNVTYKDAFQYFTAVKQWGNTGLTSLKEAFWNCSNLKSVANDVNESFLAVTTFEKAFYKAAALEEIPAGIFNNCPKVTSFRECFNGCSALVTLPAGLFSACKAVTTFRSCFDGCSKLASIPEGLFANNPAVTDFFGTFKWCALKEVPANTFENCTKVTGFGQIFYACSALETVPVSIFDDCLNVTTFSFAFSGTKLKGESPYTMVEGVKVHLYERAEHTTVFKKPTTFNDCFTGCTDLIDFEQIQAAGWAK